MDNIKDEENIEEEDTVEEQEEKISKAKTIFLKIKKIVKYILNIILFFIFILIVLVIFSFNSTDEKPKYNIIDNSKKVATQSSSVNISDISSQLTDKYFTSLQEKETIEIDYEFIVIRKGTDGKEEYTLYVPYKLEKDTTVHVANVKIPKDSNIDLIKGDKKTLKITKQDTNKYGLIINTTNDSLIFAN